MEIIKMHPNVFLELVMSLEIDIRFRVLANLPCPKTQLMHKHNILGWRIEFMKLLDEFTFKITKTKSRCSLICYWYSLFNNRWFFNSWKCPPIQIHSFPIIFKHTFSRTRKVSYHTLWVIRALAKSNFTIPSKLK